MRKNTLLLLLFTLSSILRAQSYHIEGFIKDSFTKEAIDSVQIALLNPADSTIIEEFWGLRYGWWQCYRDIRKPGKYIMRFRKDGYHTTYKNVYFKYIKLRRTGDSFGDVWMCKLPKKNSIQTLELGEVTVAATKIKMVMKGDTIVYNADAFQLSNGSMLDNLLKILPGMKVNRNGQIYMNGEQVQSLLVNGEDFFKGDPKVALDNLPAYMVEKVKVYRKLADKLVALEVNPRAEGKKLPLVVDVNLKREYSMGLMGNTAVGYGTDNHYQARLFGLYFRKQTRMALVGNTNDVLGDGYYDGEGNFQTRGNAGNTTTHEARMDFLHNGKNKKWKLSDNLNWKWSKTKRESYSSTITFLNEGDVYGRNTTHNTDNFWAASLKGTNSYTPRKGQYYELKPDLEFTHWNNRERRISADFLEQLNERYMGEALDSLFMPGSSEIYRENLISSLFYNQVYKADAWRLGGSGSGSVRYLLYDQLNFSFGGNYKNTHNHTLYDAHDAAGSNRQARYHKEPIVSYNYFAQASYQYALNLKNNKRISLVPSYKFSQAYYSDKHPYYNLVNTPLENWSMDQLNSTKDDLSQWMDRTNTYYSKNRNLTHEGGMGIYYVFFPNNKGDRNLDIDLGFKNAYDKYEYTKNRTEVVHRTKWFFSPNVQYTHQQKTDKMKHEYKLGYRYYGTAPLMGYLIDYTDEATPLVVRHGNPNLKDMYTHTANFNYKREIFKNWTMYNFNINYTLWENMLCQAITYDAKTGVRSYRPDVIDGNWNLNGRFELFKKIIPKWDLQFRANTSINYHHSVDLAMLAGNPIAVRSSVNQTYTSQNVHFTYNRKQVYMDLTGTFSWNHSTGNRFDTMDAFDYNYGFSTDIPFFWGIVLKNDMKMYSRRGYNDNNYNTDQFIWSARLRKSFLNGTLGLEANVFDILNNMSSYSYFINAQMQSERYYNVLRRYGMLTLLYRFNMTKKHTK
ncbi:MAG: outer membrane beta-barrel family protein [Paraprevotella sp.]|nr:outer membrane beta-barrel family protein [Paraprevotella sp.]